jgi:hypothetical protein
MVSNRSTGKHVYAEAIALFLERQTPGKEKSKVGSQSSVALPANA